MTVTIGYISDEHVHAGWAMSLARTMAHCGDLIDDDCAIVHASGCQISHLRNQLVQMFLAESDADWLWMIDTDHTFESMALRRMVEAAEADDLPILSGVTPVYARQGRWCRWNLWEITDSGRQMEIQDAPADTVIRARTGAGCLLIHRRVLEAMDDGMPSPWFRETYDDQFRGEDFWFIDRAEALGFPCHAHTGVHFGHTKPIDLEVSDILPPAPIVAVIPTISNTDGLERVVDGLTGNVDRIVIIDNGAEGRHLKHLHALDDRPDVQVYRMTTHGIHHMWNHGINVALDEHPNAHVLFCNDDITLGERVPQRLRRTMEGFPALLAVSPVYDDRPRDADVYQTLDICANRYTWDEDNPPGLAGFCFMVANRLLRAGYRFPQEYRWWYGDNHLVEAIGELGGRCGIVTACTVEHPPDGLSWLDEAHPRRDEVLADIARWEAEHAPSGEAVDETAARA